VERIVVSGSADVDTGPGYPETTARIQKRATAALRGIPGTASDHRHGHWHLRLMIPDCRLAEQAKSDRLKIPDSRETLSLVVASRPWERAGRFSAGLPIGGADGNAFQTDEKKMLLRRLRSRVAELRTDTYALYYACRDPRVPWYAKALLAVIVGYVISPIDLIPDFIPVLGSLDELVLVPLGIAAAVKLIPASVWEDCRARSRALSNGAGPRSWLAGALVIVIWALLLAGAAWLILASRRPGTKG